VAEVLLFHHAQGRTPGVLSFADDLRTAGHVVHTPDLYAGRTFPDLDSGVAHAEEIGFDTVVERGRAEAAALPADLVYVGFSLGVLPAQLLAQTRPGARGAVLLHGSVPLEEFGGRWPTGLPLQLHTMADDDLGDVDVARRLAATVPGAELFVHPGDAHLFTDDSLAAFDPDAAALVRQRVLGLLARLG
jgi:dienelactone hydrolase